MVCNNNNNINNNKLSFPNAQLTEDRDKCSLSKGEMYSVYAYPAANFKDNTTVKQSTKFAFKNYRTYPLLWRPIQEVLLLGVKQTTKEAGH